MTLGNGILVGVVTSLEDPLALARVRVKLPALADAEGYWAQIASPMAGKDRGTLFRPEVGDSVLVACEMGDINRLYVLGALWNQTDTPPALGDPAKENNLRVIRSRSGHILKFNDKAGAETIELIDKDNKRKLTIECAAKTVNLRAEGEGDTLTVAAPSGTVKVTAAQKIEIEASKGDVAVSAAAGTISLKAMTVKIEATGELSLKGGQAALEASGLTTIRGTLVKIN